MSVFFKPIQKIVNIFFIYVWISFIHPLSAHRPWFLCTCTDFCANVCYLIWSCNNLILCMQFFYCAWKTLWLCAFIFITCVHKICTLTYQWYYVLRCYIHNNLFTYLFHIHNLPWKQSCVHFMDWCQQVSTQLM